MHVSSLQALADPTRFSIVEILRDGELTVNEIVGNVEIDQSGVSRHLRILHQAGFVQMRPVGQKRLYSLRPEPFQDLDAWISTYRRMWEKRLDRFAEALHATQQERSVRTSRKGKKVNDTKTTDGR
jgi:DNA-binding transcriptional ArsR family regulator